MNGHQMPFANTNRLADELVRTAKAELREAQQLVTLPSRHEQLQAEVAELTTRREKLTHEIAVAERQLAAYRREINTVLSAVGDK